MLRLIGTEREFSLNGMPAISRCGLCQGRACATAAIVHILGRCQGVRNLYAVSSLASCLWLRRQNEKEQAAAEGDGAEGIGPAQRNGSG
jgi:hypothetical protein